MITIEDIVEDFISKDLSNDNIKFLTEQDGMRLSFARMGLRMHIRNKYNFWNSHPLTKNWRENESSRDIRDGVDYSEDHPDNISGKIAELIIAKLKE